VRPLLIGEAPGRTTVDRPPFHGRGGRLLAELAGVERIEEAFEPMNLLRRWPGPAGGKGSAFPLPKAREAAEGIAPLLRGRRTIFVGRRVASAFRLARLPYLTWRGAFALGVPAMVAVVPHPSGVNHFWNDPASVELARAFLREAAA
jgi:uracil-DNA glycosylase